MKIRGGFVSNSSSSSFIIGVDPASKQDQLATDIIAAMKGHYFDEDSWDKLGIITREDVLNYFRERLWSAATEEDIMYEHEDDVETMIAALNAGKNIYEVRVDYNNQFAQALIDYNFKGCILIDWS